MKIHNPWFLFCWLRKYEIEKQHWKLKALEFSPFRNQATKMNKQNKSVIFLLLPRSKGLLLAKSSTEQYCQDLKSYLHFWNAIQHKTKNQIFKSFHSIQHRNAKNAQKNSVTYLKDSTFIANSTISKVPSWILSKKCQIDWVLHQISHPKSQKSQTGRQLTRSEIPNPLGESKMN